MKKFESVTKQVTKPLRWSMALLLAALVGFGAAGCGGGGGQGPILGGGGGGAPAGPPAGAVIPGIGTCAAAVGLPLTPQVTSSNPSSGNLLVTTSTTGVAGGGKQVTATFSLAMNPATIISPLTTFTLTVTSTGLAVPGAVVTMNAANTVATLTTPSALLPGTNYTAIITTAAKTPGGVALACPYAWTFKTAAVAGAGLAPINMGAATTFGIAAHAGVTNTNTLPLTNIHGDVLLNPVAFAQCNAVNVDTFGGFGLCGSTIPTSVPILAGTVISPFFDPTGSLATVVADLNAAFLSITPPAGPPAAGSLGGATAIAAPTTLGGAVGLPYTVGVNYFTPGVYQSITSILITGDLTLDALGNPDAVFVFQSSSTLGTAAGAPPPFPAGLHTRILLIGGAKASNVWWQVATDATLGLYSEFQGNILAARDITLKTGATSCGRSMAGAWVGVGGGSGAFVFDSNVVSVPGQPFAPPATYSAICL